jgi:hypothetical protein
MRRYSALAFLLILLLLAGCQRKPTNHEVIYEVIGIGPAALISYEIAGGIEQQTNAPLTWKSRVLQMPEGSHFSVSAQSADMTASSLISCAVLVDGKPVRMSNSRGPGVTVTCQGTLGEN